MIADLSLELHELVLAMDKQADELLRPVGLTLSRYKILFVIAEHPGISARELAAGLRITESAVSQALPALFEADLARSARQPGAGRRRPLFVTETGAERLRTAGVRLGDSFDDLVRSLGHDPQQLAATLRTIRKALT